LFLGHPPSTTLSQSIELALSIHTTCVLPPSSRSPRSDRQRLVVLIVIHNLLMRSSLVLHGAADYKHAIRLHRYLSTRSSYSKIIGRCHFYSAIGRIDLSSNTLS